MKRIKLNLNKCIKKDVPTGLSTWFSVFVAEQTFRIHGKKQNKKRGRE
jgi:hypothetical protein